MKVRESTILVFGLTLNVLVSVVAVARGAWEAVVVTWCLIALTLILDRRVKRKLRKFQNENEP